jgi:beta-carotene hydroxylase
MRPRHASDYRTLLWAFVFFPAAPALAYALPGILPWCLPALFYLSYCSGVLTHNHTHVPVFGDTRMNRLYSAWLSIFYGCPVAFWIPTHQLNHHRFVNGPGDVTRTDRRSQNHTAWQALVYSLSCALWQRPLIARYVRRARQRGGSRWHELKQQVAALVLAHAALLALALALYGLGRGLSVYALAFGLPALLAPTFMMFTNYIQHVHCEPGSPHSRDFTSRLSNWLVFDAGYHTVHHEHPSLHWSQYARLHRERTPTRHPSLEQRSIGWFCLENYVLGPLWPKLRTRPLAGQLTTAPLGDQEWMVQAKAK